MVHLDEMYVKLNGEMVYLWRAVDHVPAAGLVKQTYVGDFHTVDLFFKYDFPQEGVFNNLELNLTVTNVLDQSPPLYYGGDIVLARAGFLNGNTFGRLVQIGFRRKF